MMPARDFLKHPDNCTKAINGATANELESQGQVTARQKDKGEGKGMKRK